MIISIGYATCHWCHVMEDDSFENEEVAALMNEYFIPVKVDREERPDVDLVYMHAVQLMTGKGGWPLNCITLPDGKPLYGGTFFPRKQWIGVLNQVRDLWKYEPDRCRQYAGELVAGLRKTELISKPSEEKKPEQIINAMVQAFENSFDRVHGGFSRVPKFPMPGNLLFLLRYAFHTESPSVKNHVMLTLDKMAAGGIYDHLAGGFARYSTDSNWKIPHFEKMLYDNAQLISLYASAFAFSGNENYRLVVEESMQFVMDELLSPDFGFYSALDADTEGEEGRFYVWRKEEIERLLGADAALFCKAYGVHEEGYWEHDKYVLVKNENMKSIAIESGLNEDDFRNKLMQSKKILYKYRQKRVKPECDDKFILSWNALMLSACCDVYRFTGKEQALELARKNYGFIVKNLINRNGQLLHSTHPDELSGAVSKNQVYAFADDYAAWGLACLNLFIVTADESYLDQAIRFCNQADHLFTDPDTGLLFYTSGQHDKLIVRRTETEDNVIPSANSMYAHLLFMLGRITGNNEWEDRAFSMCRFIESYMTTYPTAFSYWGMLLMNKAFPFFELAITGKNARLNMQLLLTVYQPDILLCASDGESEISLFKNRFVEDETRFYLCQERSCLQPVKSVEEIITQIKSVRKLS